MKGQHGGTSSRHGGRDAEGNGIRCGLWTSTLIPDEYNKYRVLYCAVLSDNGEFGIKTCPLIHAWDCVESFILATIVI